MASKDKFNEASQKQILNQFRSLIRACNSEYDKSSMKLVRDSFDFLLKHTRRKQPVYGIPMIEYATGLAKLTVKELGLDAIGATASLLMHCVEVNQVPLETIQSGLGKRSSLIADELLKISHLDTKTNEGQAENMRNLILTLATDFRVILVKIA